jgi:flagellar biosynthesis component FlhA
VGSYRADVLIVPGFNPRTIAQAIERMARSIASRVAENTPSCQLARFQLDLETVFRQQQQRILSENQARVSRIQAKMNQVLRAKKSHVTVQEMNKVYDQVLYILHQYRAITT